MNLDTFMKNMFYLKGKGSWSRVSQILTPIVSSVAVIHDGNTHKHPYLSYQKDPEKSDSSVPNLVNAMFRHFTVYSVTGKQDIEASHLDHLMCRTWMLVTIAYREMLGHTVPAYVRTIDTGVLDTLQGLEQQGWICQFSHVALEPYIVYYKLWLSDTPLRPLPSWVYNSSHDEQYLSTLFIAHSHMLHILSTLLQHAILHPKMLITPEGSVLEEEQKVDTLLHYVSLLYYSQFIYWRISEKKLNHLTGNHAPFNKGE